MKKTSVLMCGSDLSVRGGMVSVIKNYLGYKDWDAFDIHYIPTHIEKNKVIVALYFMFSYIRILLLAFCGKIDIAYFHTAERGSFYRKSILVRTLRRFGIKTVMHHHAAEFEEFYNGLSLKKKIYVNKTLEYADLNIVLSNRLTTMITDRAPKATVKVLYNAVKTYKENPYNYYAKNILFLGRLGERKGIYDLLEALKNVNEKLPEDVEIYLCGDGAVDEVKKIINSYGIMNRVKIIGWIDEYEKENIFKQTMVNILPSYNEGLPMTILETMAYGIPNISTNIASIPEVIQNGKNGYLIKPGDTVMLERLIISLANDDELRKQISNNSWNDIIHQFALDTHMEKLKQYLNELS